MKNGMAILEEFLQEKYVDHYDELSKYESKVEGLSNLYSEYFYIPADYGIGGLRYVIDSKGHALFLINKSGLPKDIRESLMGGEAGNKTYLDYQSLNDVYGVTKDLKVYYCSNGSDSIYGIGKDDLDDDDQERPVFNQKDNPDLYKLLESYDKANVENEDGSKTNDGILTAEELKNVIELKIYSDSGITTLKDLYNFLNLERLILDNVNLDSLSGLENVGKLNYLSFVNYKNGGNINNYSLMARFKTLQYLYVVNGNQTQVDSVFENMKGVDYAKLEYLGIYSETSSSKTEITDISKLGNLTESTKRAVKYMYLYNNNLSSIDSLINFLSVVEINVSGNSELKSLSSLKNMSGLINLYSNGCNIGADDVVTESGERNNENDSLYYLSNKSNLKYVNLERNPNLRYVGYLSNCVKVTSLFLKGCPNLLAGEIKKIAKIYLACGVVYRSIDQDLEKFLSSSDRLLYNIAPGGTSLTFDSDEIQGLINNTECKDLNLSGNTSLTNEQLQNILSTMTNIEYLNLDGIKNLTSINFVKNMPNLIELVLFNTGVTDVSPLSENCDKLVTLALDNGDINLTTIQDVISNMISNEKSYYSDGRALIGGYSRGLVLCSNDLWVNLEKCDNITSLLSFMQEYSTSNYSCDLSESKLESIYIHGNSVYFTFPSSLTNIECRFPRLGFRADGSLCDKIINLAFGDFGTYNFSECLKSFSTFPNLETLKISSSTVCRYDLSDIGGFPSLTALTIVDNRGDRGIYIDDISSLSDTLTTLSIGKASGVNTDFSKIGDLINLTSLTITNTEMSNIDFLSRLTKLTYLKLNNNKINNCIPLRNLRLLTYLNLENNQISFFSSNEKNLEILANLNPKYGGQLVELYLEGNEELKQFNDFSYLTADGIVWTRKSGF